MKRPTWHEEEAARAVRLRSAASLSAAIRAAEKGDLVSGYAARAAYRDVLACSARPREHACEGLALAHERLARARLASALLRGERARLASALLRATPNEYT